ncbi:MAG: ACP S-malonyltransferase [Actinomycetota bacterium]
MRVAMFPGQGIVAPQVADALVAGGEIVARAEEILEIPLRREVRRVARRPKSVLPTRLAQPAIVVASLARWAARDDRASFGMLTGHSLGQLSALAAGGSVSLRGVLRLVRARADAMETAAMAHPGGMIAVLGIDLSLAEDIAASAGACVANDNCPGQVVLSGPDPALASAAAAARRAGGRSIRLQVTGPFHSRSMAGAARAFQEAVMTTEFRSPRVPLVSDITARPMNAPGEIRKRLVEQLTGRVDWRGSVAHAANAGATGFVDIGPGEVLQGLVERCRAAGTPETSAPEAAVLTRTGARDGD